MTEEKDMRGIATPTEQQGIDRMLEQNRLIREAVLANIERKKKEKFDKMMNPKRASKKK